MTATGELERGRQCFQRRAWADAYAALSAAAARSPLDPEDLERLATAARLVGQDAACADALERAHHAFLAGGDGPAAARCAFWLGFGLLQQGDTARGSGWLARAERVLADGPPGTVLHAYLGIPAALAAVGRGEFADAHDRFAAVAEAGERHGDSGLVMLARHGQGRALIRMGEIERGAALLDEAMVGVTTSPDISPVFAGIVYCSVIEACHEIFDLRRAGEWTDALTRWCAAQPGLVPYRGQCLIHRAQILQFHGAWADAAGEADAACDRLADPPGQPALGLAYYQRAELHRLRGEARPAEEAYHQAAVHGRDPQPGLALLRLAEGNVEAARAAVQRALDETRERGARLRLLAARVEIALPHDQEAARAACEELAAIAEVFPAPYARAVSAHAAGALRLADGDAAGALSLLRDARAVWQELDAPYDAARAGVLIGQACWRLGDHDGAATHWDAAEAVFRELGAMPDLAGLPRPDRQAREQAPRGLTRRELEVLRLVAAGRTNREIAEALVISEHTVARHVQNMFTKLGVQNRAAATAYAYDHDLV